MSEDDKQAGHERRYDAFISYSHAADAELASALADAMRRFATPWNPLRWRNRVRTLRVFRDESAMAPTAGLWATIQSALEASDWLILLASVDAATSEWIEREVSWWCANKPVNRILLACTDGDLSWDRGTDDFDRKVSDALPPRLFGAFAHEPLWLDLRWTRQGPGFDAGDPRLGDTVASFAAAVRGIDKDELIGEDIRQHRRLQYWRNAAFCALLLLLLIAIGAAELARQQRNEALAREAEAVEQRKRAERQLEISLARRLAGASMQMRIESVERIELSLLLAVESARREQSLIGARALTRALVLTPARSELLVHKWGSIQPYAMVLGIAYSADGTRLASANEDGSVALWDIGQGRRWHKAVSGERLRQIAFSPDGGVLAVGGDAGLVSMLRADSGEVVDSIEHDDRITGIDFSPNGELVATASEDGSLRIVEIGTQRVLGGMSFGEGDLAEIEDMAFDPRGKYVAAINEGGRVCLWDLVQKRESTCMLTRAQGLHLAISADGKNIASANENIATIWDVASGEAIHRFVHEDLDNFAKMAFWNWLNDIAFHPGGRFVATAGRDGSTRLWDIESGQEVFRRDHAGPVSTLAFSPDGTRLAAATDVGTLRVWEVPSGRESFRIANTTLSSIQTIAFSPDGSNLAAGDWGGEIGIWSMDAAIKQLRIVHDDDVERIAFSRDGRLISTTSDNHMVRLWDRENGNELAAVKRFNPRRVVFADDDRHLVLHSQAGGVEFLELDTINENLRPGRRYKGDYLLTPRYVLRWYLGEIDIWKSAGGKLIAKRIGKEQGLPIDASYAHADADLLAVAYRDQGKIELWDIAESRYEEALSVAGTVRGIAISPRGDRLAVVFGERPPGAGRYDPLEYRIEILDRHHGGVVERIPLASLKPNFMHFFAGGDKLYFGSGSGNFSDSVHIIDLRGDIEIRQLEDVREFQTIRVSPDGEHILINNTDRVQVWNVNSGKAVAQIPATGYINSVEFTPDGRYVATASRDDELRLWIWRSEELVERACALLTRNFFESEWRDFLPEVPYRQTCPGLPSDPP